MMELASVIDRTAASLDNNGIYVAKMSLAGVTIASKTAWQRIHSMDIDRLGKERKEFDDTKLEDHLRYLAPTFNLDQDSIYLEIGCGPAHIAEYIMKKYGCSFIGVDFDYPILLTLKRYLESKGFVRFLLIHCDIKNMPIKSESIDYVYGGGVVEHSPDTQAILKELNRVLKHGGVSFNTVPAFNLWWLTKFYYAIPNVPVLRNAFEFMHSKILVNRIFESSFGYELAFTRGSLIDLHEKAGFERIAVIPFAVNASPRKIRNGIVRGMYFLTQKNAFTTGVYGICASKGDKDYG